jgi:hypothetical protein
LPLEEMMPIKTDEQELLSNCNSMLRSVYIYLNLTCDI